MDNVKNARKPGRAAFFQDQDADGHRQEDYIPENGNSAIDPGTDAQAQLRSLLDALRTVKKGDFSVRLPKGKHGVLAEIAEAFNDVVSLDENMANEIARGSRIIGDEGKVTERVSIGTVMGSWNTIIESVNSIINYLVQPTEEFGRVISSVAEGNLAKKWLWKSMGGH